jgi:hypothetical protein
MQSIRLDHYLVRWRDSRVEAGLQALSHRSDQHDRIADHGDGDEHVRQLIMNRRPHELSRTTNLRYVRDNQEKTLTVDARSPLGKLAEVAEKLASRYRRAASRNHEFT